MSWTTHLQDASFRGVRFDCQRTQDAARRDTASLEYPYRDGADVEDLGSKARQIQLTAVFWGPDYGQRLQRLLDVLSLPGYGELVHPVFGSVPRAQLTGYQVSHDAESPDYCTVELEFVEATPADPLFLLQLPQQLTATLAQLSQAAREYGISTFADAIDALRASVPMARQLALRQVTDRQTGEHRQRHARADPGDLDQLAEGVAFGFAGETVKELTVLAHDEMRQQRHLLAVARQVVEGAHRHVDFVADAMYVDEHLGRVLFEQDSGQSSDHLMFLASLSQSSVAYAQPLGRQCAQSLPAVRVGDGAGQRVGGVRTGVAG